MNKLVNGKLVPLTQAEITQREQDAILASEEQARQVEDERVASIWEQIKEQEQLAIRAVLENDTVWIETRKNNIIALKGEL